MLTSKLKIRSFLLMSTLIVLLGMCASNQLRTFTTSAPSIEPPLRTSETVSDIIADLEDYIPVQMDLEGVPGLAIALIRDSKVVWAEGFGVANTITGKPVTADTIFEVASISKVVTAYTALRLVEQGLISLDEPVVNYMSEHWLSPSEYQEQITLRHLASHSSGLSNKMLPLDKSIIFKPGSDYLYSGVGALYIQEVIEQVTEQSLDEVAKALVLEPLAMSSSGFRNNAEMTPQMANGYLDYRIPVLIFTIPFVVVSILLGLVRILILRFRSGTWWPTQNMRSRTLLFAGSLTLLGIWLLLGTELPNLVLLITAVGIFFALVLALMDRIGLLLLSRLPDALQGGRLQGLLRITWLGLSLFLLLRMSVMITGPLPVVLSPQPSANGSLRATATDLAKFLIEVTQPQLLNAELATQLRTPQVSAGRKMSWGLGPGILHSEHGDALWQNGQTPGFRSLMVIYPEQQIGVVVLTNSDRGFPLACDVTQRALGGSGITAIIAWLE
jgi:CubicO group peptidase (beta-lactamase class C family)